MHKHTDDDGNLTILASGNNILVACDKGHYWLVPAQQQSVPRAGADRAAADAAPFGEELVGAFGPEAADALGMA